MDINYKILWFEDTDESYDTLSRRSKRYVESKNLICTIERIWGTSDFEISKYDLNSYDVLVVDLQLSEGSKGYEIIDIIRSSNYVNDILFYSSAGVKSLDAIMKEHRLEGVFLSERDHKQFIAKLKQLVDKSIRRSENIINIRGVVMDETSEFDAQMVDIITLSQNYLSETEKNDLKEYVKTKLLKNTKKSTEDFVNKYLEDSNWTIPEILSEHEFTSYMKTRLVNKIINITNNRTIRDSVISCKEILPEIYSGEKVTFTEAYKENIIDFRNMLAHVKNFNAVSPVYIGEISGKKYFCDSSFCFMMRENLIKYRDWFDKLYDCLEKIEKKTE